MLEIDEKVLNLHVAKLLNERIEKEAGKRTQDQSSYPTIDEIEIVHRQTTEKEDQTTPTNTNNAAILYPHEKEVLRYALKYGALDLCEACDENGNSYPIKVIEYIAQQLQNDDISFLNPLLASTFNEALKTIRTTWEEDYARQIAILEKQREESIANGIDDIRKNAIDLNSITAQENKLTERVNYEYLQGLTDFNALYIEKILISSPDDNIRRITTDLVSERHILSKVHTKYTKIETEQDRLTDLVPRAILGWKDAILDCNIRDIQNQLKDKNITKDADVTRELMAKNIELNLIKKELAKYLGERIIAPRK
jgi:DNA primase